MTVSEVNFRQLAETISKKLGSKLGDNDSSFFKRVYETGAEEYRNRLSAIGMLDQANILDAGCGFGQWTLCLSNGKNRVDGIDISPVRVEATNLALIQSGVQNARAFVSDLTRISVPNETYDAVFCYGALFCAPWKEALQEFSRVLKPRGKLYFSANEIGFIAHLWIDAPNRQSDYDPEETAALTLSNTLRYEKDGIHPRKGQLLINRDQARKTLVKMGFTVDCIQDEGTIHVGLKTPSPTPFFKGRYYGLPGCYEVLATLRK